MTLLAKMLPARSASKLATLLVAGLWLAGCGGEPPGPAPTTPVAREARDVGAAAAELAALVEEYFERNLELNPLLATSLSDHRWDDRLANDIGPEHRARQEALEREFLERIEQIDPAALAEQGVLTWEVFKRQRENAIEGLQFPSWLVPVNQFRALPISFAQLGSGSNIHPFKTIDNYEDFLGRIEDFDTWVGQAIANMREGIERGYVNPRVLMERALPQLEAHIVDAAPASLFYEPIVNLPETMAAADRERLAALYERAIEDTVVPAYRRLRDFIADEYLAAARASVGLDALPNGAAWYAHLVRTITTTDLTPDEIHRIGLDEVARIHAEMDRTIAAIGFDGDRRAFFELLRTDPQFYYTEREDLIEGFRALRDRVHGLAPRLFARFPRADYEIRPVEPFRERSAAGGSYQRPAPDGSRPGIFYANTYDLMSRPKWDMESLFLHEAVPGHHFQIALQQELEGLPRFRRFGTYTAYVEGWGLYAETLGRELGVYTDPYQYFGHLNAELFRAARLVVDTGLHSKGWTREAVLEYLLENTALGESDATAETERYIAIPGQALAYKIGQLKIRELRDRAAAALGTDFDVREFHDAILRDGSLPLDVLEAKIDRWIAARGT